MAVLKPGARFRGQCGQSIVEMLVLCLALLPLFLAVPLLGKWLDMSQHALFASRYAAFEAMVRHSTAWGHWKSDADLSREVRRRFFSASDAPIKTKDAAGDFAAHRNPLWTDHRGQPLLSRFGDQVEVHATQRVYRQPFGARFAEDLSLPQDNLHRAMVRVRPNRVPGVAGFDVPNLSVEWTTTLLADAWIVADGDRVGQKIHESSQAFPARIGIQPAAAMHAPWLRMMGERTPRAGLVKPDVIPADRLGEYR